MILADEDTKSILTDDIKYHYEFKWLYLMSNWSQFMGVLFLRQCFLKTSGFIKKIKKYIDLLNFAFCPQTTQSKEALVTAWKVTKVRFANSYDMTAVWATTKI